jgi:peptide/nickel transport system permease protein
VTGLRARPGLAPPPGWERPPSEWDPEAVARAERDHGPLRRLVRDLRRIPALLAGLILLGAFAVVGVLELILVPWGSLARLPQSFAWVATGNPPGPSPDHPFGILSGALGTDLFSALLQATPWDLAILGTILGLAFAFGTAVGAWAGFSGGVPDATLTSLSDLVLAVPPFFLVIILFLGVAVLVPPGGDVPAFLLLFVVVLLPYYARPVRARAERVSREPYVEAARAAGGGDGHILRRHVLPNSLYPVFAQVPIDVYNVFFVLTVFPFLACLGAGVTPGQAEYANISPFPVNFPEWGNILAEGTCNGWSPYLAGNFWWMYLFPAVVIVLFGLAVMLTCDGLERLLHGRSAGA